MNLTPVDPSIVQEAGSAKQPASFLQTPFWTGFKALHEWKALYFLDEKEMLLSVLVRPFSRLASIAYIPLGPAVSSEDPTEQGRILSEYAGALKPYLPSNTMFVRFDPPWETRTPNAASGGDENAPAVRAEKFPPSIPKPAVRAPAAIQPPDTVMLDLTFPPETLLSQMKQKWRYNVKLGEKKGVTIRFLEGEEGAAEGLDIFYALYLETAKRDGIAIHSKNYYAELIRRAASYKLSAFDKPVSVRVYVAEHEGSALASIITLFCGEEAVYLYGASSNEKRNLMPAYSLQWRAIQDAMAFGCRSYDFYGIPPTDDAGHPMHGLYRFKTGFGGEIVHRTGSWDIPLKGASYGAYRIAERLRAFWFKKAVKRLRGIRRSS
jgi:lipid II:glycine glycyltransferase (peptidoglycan interpeptide bridge formation enzyme)